MTPDLIEQYKLFHKSKREYGYGKPLLKIGPELEKLLKEDSDIKSVLDFGCGKGALIEHLEKHFDRVYGYDPAIEGREKIITDHVDLLISTDVFEHFDLKTIDDEIQMILATTPNYILLNIATCTASNFLPNGQNCHTIVWKADKWISFCAEKFKEYTIDQTRIDQTPGMAPGVIILMKKNPVSI